MPLKNRTNKRKIRKSLKIRRRKQKGGGDPISKEDILFQDADICILKPDVKKGVLIFTDYKKPADMLSLCEAGIKTGAQLHREGVNFGKTMIHDYIFFKAPYLSKPIDYASIDTEIASSFGSRESALPSRIWIRIDPEKSYVYSSEIRQHFRPSMISYGTPEYLSAVTEEVRKSRKPMNSYLQILGENERAIAEITPGVKPFYDLIRSKVALFRIPTPISYKLNISINNTGERSFLDRGVPPSFSDSRGSPGYPWDSNNINRHSEVLCRIPHLTPDFFVKCS